MTTFEWIATIGMILIIAANCFLIWYDECVIEYLDNEIEEGQEDTNISYIKEQMNEENIKLTTQKINTSKTKRNDFN